MSDKTTITEDIMGECGFRVVFSHSDTWCDVTAYQIEGVTILDHLKAAPYLQGYIKWDGCSGLNFPHTHLCGARDYLKHFALMKYLYVRASELMNATEEPWESDDFTSLLQK